MGWQNTEAPVPEKPGRNLRRFSQRCRTSQNAVADAHVLGEANRRALRIDVAAASQLLRGSQHAMTPYRGERCVQIRLLCLPMRRRTNWQGLSMHARSARVRHVPRFGRTDADHGVSVVTITNGISLIRFPAHRHTRRRIALGGANYFVGSPSTAMCIISPPPPWTSTLLLVV